jgi:alkanesulfonate monooxygenase SsuD/methylene tetrahydromethanopterin reductase-like flavin-dependent oxidoreductase (luciferase family)
LRKRDAALPEESALRSDTLEQAAYAEPLGFESVWLVEQHFISDLSILSAPLLFLAAVAERTKSLRLANWQRALEDNWFSRSSELSVKAER